MRQLLARNELYMWNEVVVAEFEVLSRHLPGDVRKARADLSQESWSTASDFEPGTSEYETQVSTTQPLSHNIRFIH